MATPKRERQKANHAAKVAAEQAAARARRNRRLALGAIATVVVIAAIWGVFQLIGSEDDSASSPSTTSASVDTTAVESAADYDGYRQQPTACGGDAPPELTEMTFDAPEPQDLTAETVSATIETTCGPLEVALDAATYPETVNSFVHLARQGYFDGTACHRIVQGFMVQCGDQTATGVGDPGYSIPDEYPEEGFVYGRGVVAMANSGEGSTGSQFFIVTGDASFLPANYSILGTVVGSEETLDALDAVPTTTRGNEDSNPTESVYIESITIQG